jgi:hypothetical protein
MLEQIYPLLEQLEVFFLFSFFFLFIGESEKKMTKYKEKKKTSYKSLRIPFPDIFSSVSFI